jgi:DNA-directed RNA polymerase subunit RPC12/RpoP
MNPSELAVQHFPCPSCGASLEFNPQAGKLKCAHCGWEDAIPQTAEEVKDNSYEQYLQLDQTTLTTLSTTALEVKCNNCGASVTFEPPKVAGKCPFCASPIVTKPAKASPSVQPEGIVPFEVTAKQARESIQKWLSNRWFAPSALKALAQQEKIQGVYLPFWTYDTYTVSYYWGDRGEHYYVTETYTETNSQGETETKTRQVQDTRWWPVSGRVDRSFDDLLIPATTSVDRDRLNQLEPWHLKESLRAYNSSYLAGFEAQRSQVSLTQGFESAKNVMAGTIYFDVCRNIGGDEQRVHSISTDYNAITFKHILLPVWLCAYRYQNQRYQVMVNARTAEVQGERPYSVWKITATVVSGVVLAGVMYLLFTGNWEYIRFPDLPKPQLQPTFLPVPSQKLPPVPIPSTAPVPNKKIPPAPVPSSN